MNTANVNAKCPSICGDIGYIDAANLIEFSCLFKNMTMY